MNETANSELDNEREREMQKNGIREHLLNHLCDCVTLQHAIRYDAVCSIKVVHVQKIHCMLYSVHIVHALQLYGVLFIIVSVSVAVPLLVLFSVSGAVSAWASEHLHYISHENQS